MVRKAPWEGEKKTPAGYTLAELLIAIATLGTIAGVAVPTYRDYVEKARIAVTIADIRTLANDIKLYELTNGSLPKNLNDIGRGSFPDPWGSPYEYVIIAGTSIGKLRKDQFLVPLNSDFDLYSNGKDGDSKPPLSAPQSADDILRANDGDYVGLASEY